MINSDNNYCSEHRRLSISVPTNRHCPKRHNVVTYQGTISNGDERRERRPACPSPCMLECCLLRRKGSIHQRPWPAPCSTQHCLLPPPRSTQPGDANGCRLHSSSFRLQDPPNHVTNAIAWMGRSSFCLDDCSKRLRSTATNNQQQTEFLSRRMIRALRL